MSVPFLSLSLVRIRLSQSALGEAWPAVTLPVATLMSRSVRASTA
jgi:hypothetical protein